MNNKKIITTISISLIGIYYIIYLYQHNKRKKADESVDSYESALEKLKKSKENISLLYKEPDLQTEGSYPEINYVMDNIQDDISNDFPENYVMQSNDEYNFDINSITGFLKKV